MDWYTGILLYSEVLKVIMLSISQMMIKVNKLND